MDIFNSCYIPFQNKIMMLFSVTDMRLHKIIHMLRIVVLNVDHTLI